MSALLVVAGLSILAAAHKAITGSNVKANQTRYTGIETAPNVAASGYGVSQPAQEFNRPGPLPIALEASNLPRINPLVALTPTALVRGGQYQDLIRNTSQSRDYRGSTQAERDARVNLTQYPTNTMINSRMEEAIRQARELAGIQPVVPTENGVIVPL